ncbi:MAG: D-aminoacyl-tRNA deacylase [Lachnospiraceae bacterium]
MKFLIQRVNHASVTVDNCIIGQIQKGLLILIGICETDTVQIADKMVKKLINLRIFEDQSGKTNLDISTVGGDLLLVSQFTLYADCKKGNRPSFVHAGSPEMANHLYEYVISKCKETITNVQTGSFGADMQVELENNGPFTIILDSDDICK